MGMSPMYNTSAEMVLQYLTGHSEEFEGHCPDFTSPFPCDQVSSSQPLFNKIVQAVQNQLSYGLSELQCSWAVHIHFKFGLSRYNEKNNLNLKPLRLEEKDND
jgi:hypothetical protein